MRVNQRSASRQAVSFVRKRLRRNPEGLDSRTRFAHRLFRCRRSTPTAFSFRAWKTMSSNLPISATFALLELLAGNGS